MLIINEFFYNTSYSLHRLDSATLHKISYNSMAVKIYNNNGINTFQFQLIARSRQPASIDETLTMYFFLIQLGRETCVLLSIW